MAQEGWICPRCGKVNAPWVMQCSCNRNTQILPKSVLLTMKETKQRVTQRKSWRKRNE